MVPKGGVVICSRKDKWGTESSRSCGVSFGVGDVQYRLVTN